MIPLPCGGDTMPHIGIMRSPCPQAEPTPPKDAAKEYFLIR
jgi:hypothetical protein